MPESPGLYLRLTVPRTWSASPTSTERPIPGSGSSARSVRSTSPTGPTIVRHAVQGAAPAGRLARALLSDPEVLFLDEPTSGLDPVAAREVHELIDGLRKRGVTIFLTTHRLEEAERLCDRVAILNTTLRAIGRPDELREQLFSKTLTVERAPRSPSREGVGGLPGATAGTRTTMAATYVLAVTDAAVAAPAVTRASSRRGPTCCRSASRSHSLEDVYLELIDEDAEAARRELQPPRSVPFRKELRDTGATVPSWSRWRFSRSSSSSPR